MSIPRYDSAGKGKGKEPEVNTDDGTRAPYPSGITASISHCSSPRRSLEAILMSSSSYLPLAHPSSPVQGAEMPVGRRVPVDPATDPSSSRAPASAGFFSNPNASALSLPAHLPSSASVPRTELPSTVNVPRSTPPSIAAMMGLHPGLVTDSPIKRPNNPSKDDAQSKTKRSIATKIVEGTAADEAESLPGGDPGSTMSSPLEPDRESSYLSPRLHTARLALISCIDRPDTCPSTCDIEEQTQGGVTLASQTPPDICKASISVSIIENAQASMIALSAVLEEERKIDDAGDTSIRRLPYAQVKELDPLMIESRLQAANLEARLKKLGSRYERLSSVSDHPDRVCDAGEVGAALPSIDESSAQLTQEPSSSSESMISVALPQNYDGISVFETGRPIDVTQGYSAGSDQVAPTQGPTNEQGKMRSTASSRRWTIQWRIVTMIIAGFISLGFILGSFYKLAVTHTYDSVLNNLHTSSETITSEDGSSNLTISWVNGRAAGFNATYFLNTTLVSTAEEAIPDSYAFVLRWKQEFDDTGQGSRLKSVSMAPVPSFGEGFVHSAALLSLFSILHLLFHFLLGVASQRWHIREETGIYWTSAWLQAFDKARKWIAFVASAVVTALVWAAATRALLLT